MLCKLTMGCDVAICRLGVDPGQCEGSDYKRWYYNQDQRTCLPFIFTGCGGNFNRFKNFDTCVKFCTVPIRDPRLPPLVEIPDVQPPERDRECMSACCCWCVTSFCFCAQATKRYVVYFNFNSKMRFVTVISLFSFPKTRRGTAVGILNGVLACK